MQNKDDLDEANTTDKRRKNTREDREVEVRYQCVENNSKNGDQTADNHTSRDRASQSTQHETVLKRFKKKLSRKSRINRAEKSNKMASGQDSSINGKPESFEEDDVFEGNIYEVPFASSTAQHESANMANNGGIKENHKRVAQRNSTRDQRYSEVNPRKAMVSQNGCAKLRMGGSSSRYEGCVNGSAHSQRERFHQSKSMSLPASRPQVPLPGQGIPQLPYETSSEDSSSEDWVQPPPRAITESRKSGRTQSLPSPAKLNLNYQFLHGLNDLCKCGWYWGPLSSKEAEVKLHGKPDGAFLVRDSNDNRYLLSLSFRSAQKTLHTRIEFCKGKFSFYAAPFITAGGFASVVELIENCMETSKERVYCYTKGRALNGATFPVRLTKPLSRFEYVCTLQHLCRFIIRQHYTLENISDMPLPGIMKRYLGKNHFDAEPSNT